MRKAVLLATALSAGLMANAHGAAWIEREAPQDVQIEELLRQPQAYLNMRVKFRCIYVENGELYDPLHTTYSAEKYINLVCWDDDALLWEPPVRAKPFASLYLDKARADKTKLGSLKKYEVVDITGEVASTYRQKPWVTVHTITPVAHEGRFSDNAIYHIEQAKALAADNAHDLALTHYEAALGENLPHLDKILVAMLSAKSLMALNRDEDAAALLGKALARAEDKDEDKDHPPLDVKEHAALHYLLAQVNNNQAAAATGDQAKKDFFTAAARHGQAAIDLDPRMGDAYAVLGIAKAGLGDFDAARQQCAIAIRMQPNNAETRWYLGRILDQQGQHDEAIDALKKAIDLTPKDARMHAAIAQAYQHRGQAAGDKGGADLGTAMREYDIAIRLKPNDADLLAASGEAMEVAAGAKAEVQVGSAKQVATSDLAVERYKSAVAANPKHLKTHLALAKAYQAAGNNEAAAKHMEAAVEIDPNDPKRLDEVGAFLVGMGEKEKAMGVYERALKLAPKSADAHYRVGHLALEVGNTTKAKQELEKAVELNEKHVDALCDLVELNLAAGDPKAARKALERAEDTKKGDKARLGELKAKVDAAQKR